MKELTRGFLLKVALPPVTCGGGSVSDRDRNNGGSVLMRKRRRHDSLRNWMIEKEDEQNRQSEEFFQQSEQEVSWDFSCLVLCHGKHLPIGEKQVKASVTSVAGRCKRGLLSPPCHHLLTQVFWFYPLYIFSLILSNIWYNDIAKHGFFALENYGALDTKLSDQKESQTSQSAVHREKSTDLEGVMISIAEQLYLILLLTFFFVEVYVTGFIPYIGKALNVMLLHGCMHTIVLSKYKWNLSGVSLDKRLDFFESNWAFFAGFGNPCVLAIFLFSPLVSCGVMAILFPLFVLTATGSEADKIVALPRRKWRGAGLGRVPIFFIADYMSMRVLKLFSLKLRQ
ncbi:hypothetical protein K7X08_028918 [Anisodus acutangulus]|uniref:Uncharacterized protein n=1 Tax=Anisodus acutangulus TaxID=402998 RepID=A0A9Q1KZQ0_9SOLA|nr:hypothetical protein K7X08_028918 [Anisodus acutangulus]